MINVSNVYHHFVGANVFMATLADIFPNPPNPPKKMKGSPVYEAIRRCVEKRSDSSDERPGIKPGNLSIE